MNDSICIDSVKLRLFLHEYNTRVDQFFSGILCHFESLYLQGWNIDTKMARKTTSSMINGLADNQSLEVAETDMWWDITPICSPQTAAKSHTDFNIFPLYT